ncbi:MAG: translation initiation factor [Candidatus Heimdallarchaeota archaeon]|nr:translation initiation factor [Candidatus Heimdallarchaeota archaeon]
MGDSCNICGLSEELCVCQEVAMQESRMKVVIERRKWGKYYTVITGLDPREFDLKSLAKKLRSKLACGGTVKDDNIELQGNHEFRIIDLLVSQGFEADGIDIIKKASG